MKSRNSTGSSADFARKTGPIVDGVSGMRTIRVDARQTASRAVNAGERRGPEAATCKAGAPCGSGVAFPERSASPNSHLELADCYPSGPHNHTRRPLANRTPNAPAAANAQRRNPTPRPSLAAIPRRPPTLPPSPPPATTSSPQTPPPTDHLSGCRTRRIRLETPRAEATKKSMPPYETACGLPRVGEWMFGLRPRAAWCEPVLFFCWRFCWSDCAACPLAFVQYYRIARTLPDISDLSRVLPSLKPPASLTGREIPYMN